MSENIPILPADNTFEINKVIIFEDDSIRENEEIKEILINNLVNFKYPLVINEDLYSFTKERIIENYTDILNGIKSEIKKLIILRHVLMKKGMKDNENEIDNEVRNLLESELYSSKDDILKNIIEHCLDEEIDRKYAEEGEKIGITKLICINN